MTKIITSAEAYTRRYRDIQPLVMRLKALHPQADAQVLLRFARGFAALSGIPSILNAEGLRLLQSVEGLMQAKSPPLTAIENVLPQLPSVETPHLHLFINPFPEAVLNDPQFRSLRIEFSREGGYRVFQINTNCQSNCLICSDSQSAEKKPMRFIPFPMVLLLVKQLFAVKSKTYFQTFYRGDMMFWKDKNFDADYGDLARHLKEMDGRLGSGITHGFWPSDPYAVLAARKLNALDIHPTLSVHLFHTNVFPAPDAAPREAAIKKWADRFAVAINLLEPKVVQIYIDARNPNKFFHKEFMAEEFYPMVLSGVNDALRPKYELSKDNPIVALNPVYYIGRAHNNPYFPNTIPVTKTNDPKGIHLKIGGPEKQASVLVEPRGDGPLSPLVSPAPTVGERYPDPYSVAFRNFLLKLRFLCYPDVEKNPSHILWRRFFPQYSRHEIVDILNSEGEKSDFSQQVRRTIRRRLSDLPIVSQELLYSFQLKDLLRDFTFAPETQPRHIHPKFLDFIKTCDAMDFADEEGRHWIWIPEIHGGEIPLRDDGFGQVDCYGERPSSAPLIIKYLERLQEKNSETIFLQSFDRGENVYKRIKYIKHLVSRAKSSNENFLDLFYLILKANEDLPILQPVGLIEGTTHPRSEVVLNLRTRERPSFSFMNRLEYMVEMQKEGRLPKDRFSVNE
jgi:hypothetical protein